ncbi:unnamed protein product [Prorocentrum cordatum]|uniref:Uncharacterized protein n=1 Tax=Prorocentrum cordatum TaxID=2364126 RepID=A0ABN9SVY0_9DINO|nr:unnamed protein product [Polarella glacialis]
MGRTRLGARGSRPAGRSSSRPGGRARRGGSAGPADFVEACRPWLDVVAQANFDLNRDTLVSSVQPESVLGCAQECIRACGRPVDCALLCCSALRVTGEGFIDRAEQALGVPVLTSNQCLIWESLHAAAGSEDTAIQRSEVEAVRGYGRLFALGRPGEEPGGRSGQRGA